jgi:hypothetical protein
MVKEESVSSFVHGNIPLIINSYVDIFSSFDSRPYSEKALSIDFLEEVKRATRDKDDFGLELVISVPKEKRIFSDEFRIRKRLKEHFHKHFIEKEKEINKIKKEGFVWVILGILINVLVVYGLLNFENSLLHATLGIFEIPSWFLIWEGMGKIFLDSRKLQHDFNFYRKMSECQVTFKGY